MKTGNSELNIYFKCADREEANAIESALRSFAASKCYTVASVFCDKTSDPPYSLLALVEFSDPNKRTAILIPDADSISFGILQAEAFAYYAGKRGIRFLMRHSSSLESDKLPSIDKSAVIWLECIKTYLGYGTLASCRLIETGASVSSEAYKSRVPFGYFVRSGEVVINEAAAPAVRMIFKLFAEGESVKNIECIIRSTFPDLNCPTRNQIYALIANQRYAGVDDKLTAFPAIIDNRLYLACCSSAESRGLKSKQYEFLLSSVKYGSTTLRCTEYSSTAHSPAYSRNCSGGSVAVKASDIERAVIEAFCSLIPELISEMREKCSIALASSDLHAQRLDAIRFEYSALRERIADECANSTYSTGLNISRFDRLRAELKLYEIAEEYERFIANLLCLSSEEAEEYLQHLAQLGELSRREQRFFLGMLLKSASISDDELCLNISGIGTKRFKLPEYVRIIRRGS